MPPLTNPSEARAFLIAAERIQISSCPREARGQSKPNSKKQRQPNEQRHTGQVNASDIPIAIGQYRRRDLTAAGKDDHATAINRKGAERSDDRWNAEDRDQQRVDDAKRASDRTSDKYHQSDPSLWMMLQPFCRDECTGRNDCSHREIDLSGNDDNRFTEGNDTHESGRESDLFKVCPLQKTWLARTHSKTDDEKGHNEAQLADTDQSSNESLRTAR